MISTRAGGVGLNLIAADTVLFYEQDWNPQVDEQALQRAHRIGQMNHVLSINLVTEHTIDEAIMRRAERKLWLSNNVVHQEEEIYRAEKDVEASDMKSLIIGLHKFDPTDIIKEPVGADNSVELNDMTNKVIEMRTHEILGKEVHKFEINQKDILKMNDMSANSSGSASFDFGLDEASYFSWLQKLEEGSLPGETSHLEPGKRGHLSEEYQRKPEADKKKAEEKKLAKWEALGYHSLTVKEPNLLADNVVLSDRGSVQFVYGDCTKPSKICSSEPAIILSFGTQPVWVALAVVQSYSPRLKVPRSSTSMVYLERCLSKASFAADQNSASIHMPRIGYQDGSQRSTWYSVERLLHKYASIHGINIFVYYFRRPSKELQ